ncbi:MULTISPECIES: hypothetical protein [Chryseobacterium]|uniref:Uncharacterized protein n=1 Tax=Candidatus Chryseobacterium massiliense TaxID=204089 RepID=A0A3D9BEV1_9FLAO|nr:MULTISPECIES: hypothetical protein [Chryseobacterium]REC52084.1 hypothetical protein DRF68_03885 [Candidatus Chryseobacterium massiliae]
MKLINDIVCQVYFDGKSTEKIFELLNLYLPKYEPLNLDYTSRIDSEEGFSSNKEMIDYFVSTDHIDQTFYWNQYIDNPDRISFGVNITDDNKTVFSLTIDGTIKLAEIYLNDLKQRLNSDIGVITFFNPAEYKNGLDFKMKYQ